MRARAAGAVLAGWLHRALLAAPARGLRRRALLGARKVVVAVADPPVRFDLAGVALLLPLSHDLPMLRRAFPLYSDNLRRLARAVASKYPDFGVIDIGANVGDSVALIRNAAPTAPVLCVEGNPHYVELLRANTAALQNVSIAPVFVGATTGELPASVESRRGSGHLKLGEATKTDAKAVPTVATVSLDSLLDRFPLQGRVKLLKSDTDGFEAVILTASADTLRRHRPVLFFEYDPDLLAQNGIAGSELLDFLNGVGYATCLLYDNFGDLLLAAELEDRRHLEEIDAYFRGRRSERYLDIAAFHEDDLDLYESFRAAELEFFRAAPRHSG